LVAQAKNPSGRYFRGGVVMKRFGGLYEKIISFENLYLASRAARLGKRHKQSCAAFEMNIEEGLASLRDELLQKTYRPGAYREFTIYERKPRRISAAPYRDRVVHHALCRVIEPIFERSFIHDSYACRPGKGTHSAVARFTEFARRYRYVFKTDIRKYFPSIDHDILFERISRKIKCLDTLWLIRLIIDTSNPQEEILQYYPGDDLFAPLERRRGIPIGNLTSQFFANIYLDGLDHYTKEDLQCRSYIRYVDDITAFGDDKQKLWKIGKAMGEYLSTLRLTMHPDKTIVVPVSQGVDYLGYRVFPDRRRLRKDNVVRFRRRMQKMQNDYRTGQITLKDVNSSIQSWIGHAKHADTYKLREKIFAGIIFTNSARESGRS
jgi:retron-type reverse transcriptase